jgi:hypothetical protein
MIGVEEGEETEEEEEIGEEEEIEVVVGVEVQENLDLKSLFNLIDCQESLWLVDKMIV